LKDDSLKMFSHIDNVGKVRWDLSDDGQFLSTKKTMSVVDRNGKMYRVTVEEIR